MTDPASITRLAAVAKDKLGPVDILVNNAGVAHSAPLARTTLEEWEEIIRINATGPFLCLQAFLPDMLERKWGRIVNMASMAGLEGRALHHGLYREQARAGGAHPRGGGGDGGHRA